MVKVVFRKGAVQLLEAPPKEWVDGEELGVGKRKRVDEWTLEEIEAQHARLNELCAQNDPANDQRRNDAIQEYKREQKSLMRR
jgi:hypothetical protein